jgi:hypothetical protein
MKASFIPLFALLIATLPAQDKPQPSATPAAAPADIKHQPELSFTVTLKPDNAKVVESVLYADPTDVATRGTIPISAPGFGVLNVSVSLGKPGDEPRFFQIDISPASQPSITSPDGAANGILHTVLRYRGPGTYRVAHIDGSSLTVTVRETPAK